MSVQSTIGTGVSTQGSCLAFVAAKWKAIQLTIERRSFERSLETIIRAVNAHNSGGLSFLKFPNGGRDNNKFSTKRGAELARREGRSYEPASALLARIRAERESSFGSDRSRVISAFEKPTIRRSRKLRSSVAKEPHDKD